MKAGERERGEREGGRGGRDRDRGMERGRRKSTKDGQGDE